MGDDDGDSLITITLVDNGLGDDVRTGPNGEIIDQRGPGTECQPVHRHRCSPRSGHSGAPAPQEVDIPRIAELAVRISRGSLKRIHPLWSNIYYGHKLRHLPKVVLCKLSHI